MKIAFNLQPKIPKEMKVFMDDKINPFISNGSPKKVRLKGIRRNSDTPLKSMEQLK